MLTLKKLVAAAGLGAALSLSALSTALSPAMAQVEGEDTTSIDNAYAALMTSMPRDGDLIMLPYASGLGTRGEITTQELVDADVSLEELPGGKALRVSSPKTRNNWDAVVRSPIGPGMSKGDLLVVVYYARATEGSGQMPYNIIQLSESPYTALIQSSETLTDEWQPYVIQGKAPRDIAPGATEVQFHLGQEKNTIEFGPVFVLNLGQ